MQPPSRRIADELKARIAAGDLGPGDRLPSARRLTRDHDVAAASATKAVALLRAEGLVRTVPGVGVLVAGQPARAGTRTGRRVPAAALTPDRIVRAAIAVADAEGLVAVSVRRVATDLGAAPMALYRHVQGKDDLVLRMLDDALRAWSAPAPSPPGWRQRVELGALGCWAVLRRHPWLGPALSLTRPQFVPAGMAYTEYMLESLALAGFGPAEALDVHLTVFGYVRGIASTLEPEAEAAAAGESQREYLERQRRTDPIDARAFPRIAALAAARHRTDVDRVLRLGLGRLLDGVEAGLSGSR